MVAENTAERPAPPESSVNQASMSQASVSENGLNDSLAWRIRPVAHADVPAVLGLVQASAVFHRQEEGAVEATAQTLGAALFSPHPRVSCHVVEVDDPAGARIVGMAFWFVTFSTWRGRHGIWLEELFVLPEYRRLGAGRALIFELAALCVERGYARLEWSVMDWNEPAQRFYEGLGAIPHSDMTTWRVTDSSLLKLGTRTV